MSEFEYYTRHVIPTGLQSFRRSFEIWCDLMTGKWENYALLDEDNPFTECAQWFWISISEDNTIPKQFLEDLEEILKKIESGDENLLDFELRD